jgi:hypothetical protein
MDIAAKPHYTNNRNLGHDTSADVLSIEQQYLQVLSGLCCCVFLSELIIFRILLNLPRLYFHGNAIFLLLNAMNRLRYRAVPQ